MKCKSSQYTHEQRIHRRGWWSELDLIIYFEFWDNKCGWWNKVFERENERLFLHTFSTCKYLIKMKLDIVSLLSYSQCVRIDNIWTAFVRCVWFEGALKWGGIFHSVPIYMSIIRQFVFYLFSSSCTHTFKAYTRACTNIKVLKLFIYSKYCFIWLSHQLRYILCARIFDTF